MTFIDLFAGVGGFRRGMELAGHKCVGFCEWDKFAAASYTSMHLITEEQRQKLAGMSLKERQKEILKDEYRNGEWYIPDIQQVGADNIPRVDCWCFGAPCLVAGTLITTINGMKPIEEVQVGDKVLTHANTFEKVTERMVNRKKGIYTLRVMGSPVTEVTGNHRFYVRYRKKVWDNSKRNWKTEWTSPEWKAVENFTGKEYIEFPNDKNKRINEYNLTAEEAWLIGRYIADGYLQNTERKDRSSNLKRIILCVGENKLQDFESKIGGHHYCKTFSRTCYKVQMSDKKLYELCERCGRGAANKHIPEFISALPVSLLKEFIDGYMNGDGSCKGGKYRATSVSKVLIYQLGQCINKAYGCGYQIHFSVRPRNVIIEGRKVNQKDTWQIVYHIDGRKSLAYTEDGVLWQPIREIRYAPDREETVYNLEVENEHSYTANNMGLHNCQDFSVAGKRAGLDGDRSSLVREVFRILGELKEKDRPEWLIYENVKGMLSSNQGGDFLSIILAMEELGYDIEWQVFNSKYHGVPQNRERVYTLGHLRARGERKVFPLRGADGEDSADIEILAHYDGYRRNRQTFSYNGITEALSTCEGGGREHHTAIPMFGIDYNVGGKERQIANCVTTRNIMAGVTNVKQDETAVCIPMCIDPQGRTSKEVKPSDTAPTLRAQAHGNNPDVCIPVLTPDRTEKQRNGRRFKGNKEEAFTLTGQNIHGVALGGIYTGVSADFQRGIYPNYARSNKASSHDNGVALKIREATVKGYAEAEIGDSVNLSMPESKTRCGRVGKKQANTLDTSCEQGVVVPVIWYDKYKCYIAIRKLTPKECWRLQGWTDDYFEKAQFVNSDSQLYKQAGNGVTVNVVEDIARAIGGER